MDAEDVEAWIPFWGIVGAIPTMGPGFLGDFPELVEPLEPPSLLVEADFQEAARMEPRRGALLVPLVAIIFAIVITSNNYSRTSP